MANEKELILGIEEQKTIIKALLIGTDSYGEIERIDDEVKGFDIVNTIQIPDSVRPIHPTGSNDTIGLFAEALRYMHQN